MKIIKNIITVIEYTNFDYKILKDLIQSHKSDIKKLKLNKEISEHNISSEGNHSLYVTKMKNSYSTNDIF